MIKKKPFSEQHPKWNTFIGLLILLIFAAGTILGVYFLVIGIGRGINKAIEWLSTLSSKLDAVVIVALITGAVSIIGVFISSVVAKRIDFKKSRQAYLAQKREKPYGEFVDMVYKIQQASKGQVYSQEDMLSDLSKFSKEITLWGSSKVVNKWVEFREIGTNPDAAKNSLFLLEEIMNEMRKDLGLKKAKKGNLLAFFVNDIKKTMRGNKQ